MIRLAGVAFVLSIAWGCGDDEVPTTQITTPTVRKDVVTLPTVKPVSQPVVGVVGVTGVVKFDGKAPKRRPIDMGANAECAALHSDPVLSESVIVNENGTLRNVFVWVKKGLKGQNFPLPSTPVTLDQKGCCYSPHVLGIMMGQKLVVRNSDEFMHNIHATPAKNQEFNFSQAKKGMEKEITFENQEVMMSVKCDVHGWMKSYIGVVKHPFFSVTGEDGTFTLKDLPSGEYTLEAWHEEYGIQEKTVTVKDGEAVTAEFTFQGKKP